MDKKLLYIYLDSAPAQKCIQNQLAPLSTITHAVSKSKFVMLLMMMIYLQLVIGKNCEYVKL